MKKVIILLALIGCVPAQHIQAPVDIHVPPLDNTPKIEFKQLDNSFEFTHWTVIKSQEFLHRETLSKNHISYTYEPSESVYSDLNPDVKVDFTTRGNQLLIESFYQEKLETANIALCETDSTFEYSYRGFHFVVACIQSLHDK